MTYNKIKRQKAKNIILGKAEIASKPESELLCFSLKHFDSSQGQSFKDWQKDGLLAIALETMHDCSSSSIPELLSKRRHGYQGFPPHSKFTHPRHVPQDAKWFTLHVMKRECIIGHLVGNILYIVFLDKDHKFYPTSK